MICNEIAQKILFDPLKCGADHLYIVSSYATPMMLSWYIKNLFRKTKTPVSISLIEGMAVENGISQNVHEGFRSIIKSIKPMEIGKLECSYVYKLPAVHSNLYIWTKDDYPTIAFTGSADFVQSSFVSSDREEIMLEYDPLKAMNYYQSICSRTVYVNHAEIEEMVIIKGTHNILDEENKENPLSNPSSESVRISLLTNKGYPGTRSGLNWGHRNNRNRNEAYLSIPQTIVRSGFFPTDKKHFSVMTDDGHHLIMRLEQQDNKAMTTPENNSLLGEYFRNRIGLNNGAFIRWEDLDRYGRTDVIFTKIDDELFYMDFSPLK